MAANPPFPPPILVNQRLTAVKIPCCLCGIMIESNSANQCPSCLAQKYNLQDKLQRGPGNADYVTIYQCRLCRRYQKTEKLFVDAEPESPELLELCLRHIPALTATTSTLNAPKLHLVDAAWIWTEPHSMRFKLKLTVQTEMQSVMIQQRVMVEQRCQFRQCPACKREFTNRTWTALVQLRQKLSDETAPKRGLRYLEMAIRGNSKVRKHVLKIDAVKNGFDFYFLTTAQAQAFTSFLQRVAGVRVKTTKKLVSADVKNNTQHWKHTFTCDLMPLCKDDLVLIHKTAAGRGCKLAGCLVLVTKVATALHLVSASPQRVKLPDSEMELSSEAYYKNEKLFTVLLASHRMVRFVVLDVEVCSQLDYQQQADHIYRGPHSGVEKYALADVLVARESDFGVNDETYRCVTHLGNLISVGDTVLGYDLVTCTVLQPDDWEMLESFSSGFVLPDVVLVKKITGKNENDNRADSGNHNRTETSNASHVDNDKEENEGEELPPKAGGRISKRRERRRRRKEGKRARELEESAVRMGFLEDENHGGHQQSFESELTNDPRLASELAALERDLGTVGLEEEEEKEQN